MLPSVRVCLRMRRADGTSVPIELPNATLSSWPVGSTTSNVIEVHAIVDSVTNIDTTTSPTITPSHNILHHVTEPYTFTEPLYNPTLHAHQHIGSSGSEQISIYAPQNHVTSLFPPLPLPSIAADLPPLFPDPTPTPTQAPAPAYYDIDTSTDTGTPRSRSDYGGASGYDEQQQLMEQLQWEAEEEAYFGELYDQHNLVSDPQASSSSEPYVQYSPSELLARVHLL